MKIGIDGRAAKWYRGTGIGTYTYQLINYLNKIDRLNKYLLFMPENSNCDIKLNPNFSISSIDEVKKDNFWNEVNIPNILENKDIELYHVPQNGVGLPNYKKCNFVITLHDIIPYKMPETVSDRYLKIFSEQLPSMVPLCDGIITVSSYSKNDITSWFNFPKEKVFVTPLASEDIYKPIDKKISKDLIKKYYGIEGDFILYVGGFSPRKNIVGLIESFSKLIIKYKKDINLVIAGSKGKSYTIYKKRADDLNIEERVIFPGFIAVEHLPYLYNSAELFVYPSFYEGFGLPPIEAMACGIPVIASNATSIPEVTSDAALLVSPENIDDLCEAMLNVLSDTKLKEQLSLSGLVRSSELNWEKTAKQTLIAYNKLVNM